MYFTLPEGLALYFVVYETAPQGLFQVYSFTRSFWAIALGLVV